MHYQWQFNGTNLDGATYVTLVLPSVSLDSAGNYSCIAGNAFGCATNTAGGPCLYLAVTLKKTESLIGSDRGKAIWLPSPWSVPGIVCQPSVVRLVRLCIW